MENVNIIETFEGYVRFTSREGQVVLANPRHIYLVVNNDNVSFLFTFNKKNGGKAFFNSDWREIELNGKTYQSLNELLSVIREEFADSGLLLRLEVVKELPKYPKSNRIYLVPKQYSKGYDEYVWNRYEKTWELLGDNDVEWERYLHKDEFEAWRTAHDNDELNFRNSLEGWKNATRQLITNETSARERADAALANRIDANDQEIENLDGRMDIAEDEIERLSNRVSALERDNDTLESSISSLRARIASLEGIVAGLQTNGISTVALGDEIPVIDEPKEDTDVSLWDRITKMF